MDYMLCLIYTKRGHDCMFMVANQFSKMATLGPCKKSIIDETAAKLLFEHVCVHFVLPDLDLNRNTKNT